MKFPLIIFLFLLFFHNGKVSAQTKDKIQPGLYAVYLDQSSYTEFTLNSDITFIYFERDMQGVGSRYKGRWQMKGKEIILVTSQKNDAFRPLPKVWEMQDSKICRKYEAKSGTNSLCLDYIKPGSQPQRE